MEEQLNFILPGEIHLGYQKREDTFSYKLGFVTYIDDLGSKKFENAWEGWRDEKIKSDIFKNEPTEGFVLNKHSGRQWGSFERAEFVRVFDPRGFEIEISIDNLMQILIYNGIEKGNGICGKLVYAWEYGKRKLTLLPVDSEDYKNALAQNKILQSAKLFDKKTDVIEGMTYKTKSGCILTYLGKFKKIYDIDYYGKPTIISGHIFHVEEKYKQYSFYTSPYYYRKDFNNITHMLDKNPNFNEMLLEYIDSHNNTGNIKIKKDNCEYYFTKIK